MKAGLAIVGVWSASLLFLSLAISGHLGALYAGSSYTFTLPFIISVATLLLLSIMGLAESRARTALFWVVVPLHGLLYLPFNFAASRWPGGDDGPGLAWIMLVGGGSCIAAVLSLILIVVEIVSKNREKGL
jgi:hypothetical protein